MNKRCICNDPITKVLSDLIEEHKNLLARIQALEEQGKKLIIEFDARIRGLYNEL